MEENLFKDFAGVSRDTWQKKIVADLKGQALDSLDWETAGLKGGPVYTREDLPDILPDVRNLNRQPEVYGLRSWVNYQLIEVQDDKEANRKALQALNNGADGLIFRLKHQTDFRILLAEIKHAYCHISLVDDTGEKDTLNQFLAHLQSAEADLAAINGYYQGNADVSAAVALLPDYKFYYTDNSSAKGYEPIKEIALALAQAADLLDTATEAGKPVSTLFNQLQFQLSLGTSYFTEIAKFRAMRTLAIRFASAYEVELTPGDITIFAKSSDWTEPVDDQYSYLLMATTQAMAAIIGGTDALCIQPFYPVFEPRQKVLAERIARNISNVLKDESYFDKVIDPASGSYFVESITHEMSEKAWQLFLDIESAGGYASLSPDQINTLYQKLTAQ
jgi:methylmalonyl-CoA mutase